MTQVIKKLNIFSSPTSIFKDQAVAGGSSRLKILSVPLALTIALCTGMTWYVWDFYNSFKKIQTQDIRIQQLSNDITYLDEVLTSSARLSATTGNKRWEDRYNTYVPKLDAALAEAQKLLPDVFKSEAFVKTNAANERLIAMETRAFNLVNQGNPKAATNLLLSADYEQQKEIYSQGLEEAIAGLQKYVESSVQAKSQQAFTAIAIAIISMIILLFAWLAVWRTMQNYYWALSDAGTAISTTSQEIAATVQQQERAIAEQAGSVNETTTTMDELGASSRQSAEQAQASAAGARQALNLAEEGTKAVHETMQGMGTLREKVGAIAEQIIHLSEQTGQIGGISGLVADLANQTNMLALNAAVEAARAGEHGKGFGVVASEIRKLADQSKKSAEKINGLVVDIQAAINTTVMVTDEGTKTVDRSMSLTNSTAETFTGFADSINNVFLNSQQIALSAQQQAVAVQQVVAAMNSLNLGARESATGISQVKISTQQLNEAAQRLKTVL
ncbi:methyl-accepting chemotaxis protein [Aliterella atlantica]|uniref:Chemotaxis protein n=1 Tax=Aliterella atlantica CENA595 TaxID=1618023 RepID=A0A0D8ZXU7_9CYAN|nr:methyl-accepting chemotaxis protein [Aliterella atlantica]KJH73197.1 chemotaxis protein [Aliterella atlantica CENA595]